MSDLIDDLNSLAPEVDESGAWESVHARVPQRRRRLRLQRAGWVVSILVGAVALGWTLAPGWKGAPVVDTNRPTTTVGVTTPPTSVAPTTPTSLSAGVFPGSPSQSVADAARDGVVLDLAAVPFEDRVDPLIAVDTVEGTWLVSQLPGELFDQGSPSCLGDPDDPAAACPFEYGEILLVENDRIVRAYPFPGAPVSWMHVAEEAVYAGRIGDGGLPDSTLIRIGRGNLEATVWVFEHHPEDPEPLYPPTWQVATGLRVDRFAQIVDLPPAAGGVVVDSWIGEVRIDLEGVRQFFAGDFGLSPRNLIRVDTVERCGVDCFEVALRAANPDERRVTDPTTAEFGDVQTLSVDCGDEELQAYPAAGLEVSPVRPGSCEAMLAMGRWAELSPYFLTTEADGYVKMSQVSGSWVPEVFAACLGLASDPPACRANEGREAELVYGRLRSAAAEGMEVSLELTEIETSWDGEAYVIGEEVGARTLVIGCTAWVNRESDSGDDFYRITDGCGLVEQLRDEEVTGVFEFLVGEDGTAFSASEITLP